MLVTRLSFGLNDNGFAATSRDEKGASLLTLPRDFVLIDLETTGLDPCFDNIIELCAVRVVDLVAQESWKSLVNPGYELDDFIVSLTGITDEMLSDAPSIDLVLDDFLAFIDKDLIMGHNVNFDVNFLYDNSMRILSKPFTNDFVDTMRLSRRIFPQRSTHRLSSIAEDFQLASAVAHRAYDDCLCVLEYYRLMLQHIEENALDPSAIFAKGRNQVRAADIVASEDAQPDPDSPLFGKVCVFTGKLSRFTRAQAMQAVANLGGINGDGVTKNTNFLVLGNYDYMSCIKEGKSSKHRKAEKLLLAGQDIAIMPEDVFYEMISMD